MVKLIFPFLMMIRALFVSCPCCQHGTSPDFDKYKLKEKYKLPGIIDESSGIVHVGSSYYTINDSGGEPVLYKLDSQFKLIDSIYINGFKNIDWEDLAFHDDYIYIGDFGNNANQRKNLRMIKYHLLTGTKETIMFNYPDQSDFPPGKKEYKNFDCEAMIWHDSSLILFTKSKKNNVPVNMYRIPDQSGQHVAEKIMQIPLKGKVTAASFDAQKNLLYLLTYGKIMVYNVQGRNDSLDLNPVYCKTFIRSKQSEAISITPSQHIIITNEQRRVFEFMPVCKKENTNRACKK
ncbi:MAG: hypothetical protein ACOC4B_00525 [Bacteroidota bacterium]